MFGLPISLSPMRQLRVLLYCIVMNYFSLSSISGGHGQAFSCFFYSSASGVKTVFGQIPHCRCTEKIEGNVRFAVFVCKNLEAESMVWDKS